MIRLTLTLSGRRERMRAAGIFPRFCRHTVRSPRPRLIGDGGREADPRVQPYAVVVGHVAAHQPLEFGPVLKWIPCTTSLFIEWKNDSICALSVTSRGRFMLCTKPRAARRLR